MPKDRARAAVTSAKWRLDNQEHLKEYGRNRLALHTKLLRDYKAEHGCLDCGEKDPVVLDFDHRDPTQKRFGISSKLTTSLVKLWDEVAKCDVRCCNCHRKRTHREKHWGKKRN